MITKKTYGFSLGKETIEWFEKERSFCRPKISKSCFMEKILFKSLEKIEKNRKKILEERKN